MFQEKKSPLRRSPGLKRRCAFFPIGKRCCPPLPFNAPMRAKGLTHSLTKVCVTLPLHIRNSRCLLLFRCQTSPLARPGAEAPGGRDRGCGVGFVREAGERGAWRNDDGGDAARGGRFFSLSTRRWQEDWRKQEATRREEAEEVVETPTPGAGAGRWRARRNGSDGGAVDTTGATAAQQGRAPGGCWGGGRRRDGGWRREQTTSGAGGAGDSLESVTRGGYGG